MRKRIGMISGAGMMILIIYLLFPLKQQIVKDYSQTILARDSTFLRVFLNSDQQWCLPPQISPGIPDNLRTAVLTYEDQYFPYHPGVNPVAIFRATYLNIKHGRVISGGSTLTMQLARMIRSENRTYYQKILEMLLAIKLETRYSKDEILKQYLSHAPYGSNVRGYIAASYRFFDKKPELLSWAEAATLAVLPNAPGLIFPSKNTDALRKKRDGLLLKLLENKAISQETYELSLLEPVPDEIYPFPLSAPHLTEKIHQENQLDVVLTTIDPNIQYEANFFLKQHTGYTQEQGILNACALVVDNASGNVLAYVGSQDFHNLEQYGKVDGIQAARSSGSILKPFLYALSIDEGLILPNTLIKDVPTYFSSFSPNNASEQFSGIVPANKALIYSLNIPAVRLLNTYGVSRFYNMMQAAGISTLFRTPDDYGLPLILGGSEVTPWDIAKMYRGMALGGQFGEIHYLKNPSNNAAPQKILSETASYLILEEMKELIRPGLEFYWKKYGSQKPIAWKTGTSYGHKDAWAVGCTPEYTLVVWVGNFVGESNKNLSGMRSAGPLLFNIFNALPSSNVWFEAKQEVPVLVKTCSATGFYASENCIETEMKPAPRHMKPMRICPHHEKVMMENNYVVCSHCWTGKQQPVSILSYPADVNYYLRQNGNLAAQAPDHNPKCKTRLERDVLKIIYPTELANIFVTKDFDGSYQPIVCRVASKYPQRELFWYLDDTYLGSSVNQASLPLDLNAGEHLLLVTDTEGNKDLIKFSVILN